MTIVFMSLVAAMIAERISVRAALWLWPILLVIGILSVLQWHWSEQAGHGDLRFYAAVQVYAVLVLLLVLLLPTRYTHGWYLGVVVGFYVLAKLLETFDRQVFAVGHVVSGHTLKHIVAGFAGYWILRMLEKRKMKHVRSQVSGNVSGIGEITCESHGLEVCRGRTSQKSRPRKELL